MVSPGVRFKAFTRDDFKCQYCGRSAPEVILEIDHKLPLSKGGKNNIENLVTACRECNRGKADIKITPNTENFTEQLKKYDTQFEEAVIDLIQFRDYRGNVPESLVYRARNVKIKKIKYIIEYLENQHTPLSKVNSAYKQNCIEGLPILRKMRNLNELSTFEHDYIWNSIIQNYF